MDTNDIMNANRQQKQAKATDKQLKAIELAIARSQATIIKYLDSKITKTQIVNQLESIKTPDIELVVKALDDVKAVIDDKPEVDLSELSNKLSELLGEAKKIPKELPEQKFVDYSDGLNEIIDSITKVKSSIDSKELSVNVAAPDLKGIETKSDEIVKAIEAIELPATDTSKLSDQQAEILEVLKKILKKPVGGGGSGGGGGSMPTSIAVNNFPTEYYLPDSQLDTITNHIPLKAGVDFDEITANYPDNKTDVYTYKLAGNTIQTVTVEYTDSDKNNISSVEWS